MGHGVGAQILLILAIAITILSQAAAELIGPSRIVLISLAALLVVPGVLVRGLTANGRLLRCVGLSSLLLLNYFTGPPARPNASLVAHRNTEHPKSEWLTGDFPMRIRGEPRRRDPGEIRIEGIVQSAGLKGETYLLRLTDLPWENSGTLRSGELVAAQVRVKRCEPINWISQLFSYDAYLKRRNISAVGTGRNLKLLRHAGRDYSERERFTIKMLRTFGERDSLLVAFGSTIGAGDLLSAETLQLFRDTGTTHLIVVSGFHVGIVFGVFYQLLYLLLVWCTTLPNYIAVQRIASALAAPTAAAYTWLAGAEPTAVRALLVTAIYALSKMTGRDVGSGRTLLLAFLCVILIWPGYQFEASCHLTFAALLGIHCGCSCLDKSLSESRLRKHWFTKSVVLSAFANLYTMPVVLAWFKTVVPLSFAINVVAIPLFSAIFIVGSGVGLLGQFLSIPGSEPFLTAVLNAGELFLLLLRAASDTATFLGAGVERFPDQAALCISAVCGTLLSALALYVLTLNKEGVSS